ncbi:MAG: DUF4407 domain-containing protein [Bradyrhizobium sp.]|nr:DUF4407 domain-containing protein [Bradyrhizobium sp.]
MEQDDPTRVTKITMLDRLWCKIAGVATDLIQRCPQNDLNIVRATGELQLAVFFIEAMLFSGIAQMLFARGGQVRPELVAVASFIAFALLLADSLCFIRPSWYKSGLDQLRAAGIDLTGGIWARVKGGILLLIRLLLAVCTSALIGIFVGLIVFGHDVDGRIQRDYVQANSALIAQATSQADAALTQQTDAEKIQQARVTALATQVAAAREAELDPSANDPRVKMAREEVSQLLARQAKAEQDVRDGEAFAAAELGGIKATPDNSGKVGNGPRRKAALERVADAKRRLQEANDALVAARTRLDAALTRGTADVPKDTSADAAARRKTLEAALAEEDARLASTHDRLQTLRQDREAVIRSMVENAPGYVAPDDGFLTRLTILEQIAGANRSIAAVIVLLHVAAFGFELMAVLAKLATSHLPTWYSVLLVKELYMRTARAAEEIAAELNKMGAAKPVEPPEAPDPDPEPAPGPANDNAPMEASTGFDAFAVLGGMPTKRGRGRPRKTH